MAKRSAQVRKQEIEDAGIALPQRTLEIEDAAAPFIYLVNPAGAIHVVDTEHARRRLRLPGYRQATKEEIAELERRGGDQVSDRPICPRWGA